MAVEPLLPSRMRSKLTSTQVRQLFDLIHTYSRLAQEQGLEWTDRKTVDLIEQQFGVRYQPASIRAALKRMRQSLAADDGAIFYGTRDYTLYCGDAERVLRTLAKASVDCIVTSPPYYGQRDYGVPDQIGLEPHPQQYIERLVSVFRAARPVLKPTGSLWVNLGDTYWSGKGQPQGPDLKQRHRRFLRPQDRSGPRPLCAPKQLLLIPHRFAIAMQEEGWIVRNDNVWHKINPTPDPAEDRSASAHEYMFHFVLRRRYYYDFASVSVPSNGSRSQKPPASVWQLQSAPTFKKHIATFPESLVRIPILATLPVGGTLLDPFCGSGTALGFALTQGRGGHAVGIDASPAALAEAVSLLPKLPETPALVGGADKGGDS